MYINFPQLFSRCKLLTIIIGGHNCYLHLDGQSAEEVRANLLNCAVELYVTGDVDEEKELLDMGFDFGQASSATASYLGPNGRLDEPREIIYTLDEMLISDPLGLNLCQSDLSKKSYKQYCEYLSQREW